MPVAVPLSMEGNTMLKYERIRPLATEHDYDESTEYTLIQNVQDLLKNRMQQLHVDPEAVRDWDRFHQLYDRIIRRMAAACRLGATDTDDLVQEVWMHVIQRMPDFRPSGDRYSFRGWLYTIVRHKAVDFIRRRQRHPVVPFSDELRAWPQPGSTSFSPEAEYDRCSMIAFVESLVELVGATESDTNCRVLELRIIEGRSVEHTASECRLTPEQVRKRTYHLRRRLRELAQYFTGKAIEWSEDQF